jgi:hypothetical protein
MTVLDTSQIFFNFAVGTASGVFVIFNTGSKLWSSHKQKSIEVDVKKKYPRDKMNTLFQLIDTEKAPGKIYLIDLESKRRHWISSSSTMNDLGFHWSDVIRISDTDFNKYEEGTAILTSGVQGT